MSRLSDDTGTAPVEEVLPGNNPETGEKGEWLSRIVEQTNIALKRLFDWGRWLEAAYPSKEEVVAVFTYAAYAGMTTNTGGPTSIGAAWTPVNWFTTETPTARGFTVDVPNGTVAPDNPGVYAVSVNVNIQGHNSSNGGRVTGLRLYDVTNGAPVGGGTQIGIGRNQEDTFVGTTFLIEVATGGAVRLEVGGYDSVTSIDNWIVRFQVWSVGEYRGVLGNE